MPSPSDQDRDTKEALRGFSAGGAEPPSARVPGQMATPIAPAMVPAVYTFGLNTPRIRVPSTHAEASAQVDRYWVSAASAAHSPGAAAEAVSATAQASQSASAAVPILPRHPGLDEEQRSIAHQQRMATQENSPASAERRNASATNAPKSSARSGRARRPVALPRSRLPAAPSVASLPWSTPVGTAVPGGLPAGRVARQAVDRQAQAKLAATKLAKANAAAAKLARTQAAAAKATKVAAGKAAAAVSSGGDRETGALVGLLALSGELPNIESMVESNKDLAMRRVLLGTLSKAVHELRVSQQPADKPAETDNAALGGDCELVGDRKEAGAPASKRAKVLDLVQNLCDPQYPLDGAQKRMVRTPADPPTHSKAKPSLRVPPLSAAQKVSVAVAAEVAKKRADGLTLMVGARKLLNRRVKRIIGTASKSTEVLLSPSMRNKISIEALKEYAEFNNSQATDFLVTTILCPAKDGGKREHGKDDAVESGAPPAKVPTASVSSKFNQAFSNLYGDYKRNILVGWFTSATGRPSGAMAAPQANTWMEEDHFWRSAGGREGIIYAVSKGYDYLRVKNRVRAAVGADNGAVQMTTGHYALAVTFVEEELKSIRDGPSDVSSGPDADRYQNFLNNLAAVDGFLPKHNNEHDGLILCDGANPDRAVVQDGADDDAGMGEADVDGTTVQGPVVEGLGGEGPKDDGVVVDGGQGAVDRVPMMVAAPVPLAEVVRAVPPRVATVGAVAHASPPSVVVMAGQSLALRARMAALAAIHEAQMAALLAEPDDDDGLL